MTKEEKIEIIIKYGQNPEYPPRGVSGGTPPQRTEKLDM